MTFSWNWGDGNTTSGLPASHTYAADGDYTIKLVTTSTTNNCTDTADIPVSVSHVSTKNISNPTVSVYPNPVKNGTMLNIQGINATEVHWYDVSGREVAVEKVFENATVVPTKLNAGLYWIKGGNNEQSFKASIYINN
jgi:PKD repeat protein